jgi:hypothetical protein
MATTPVSICNSALVKIGAERIVSLNDSNERARLCNEQYEKNRDDLLRSHPWNFAVARVELSASVDAPEFGFAYKFQLPSDCLRVLGTDLGKYASWKIEGRFLHCDFSEVKIKYIQKVTDTSKFDMNFTETLSAKIAADICYSLVQSVTLRDQLQKEYVSRLRDARSFDGQESQGDRVYADGWLDSRF